MGPGVFDMDIALIGFDLDIIDLIESSPQYRLHGFMDFYDASMQLGTKDIKYLGTDDIRDDLLNEFPTVKFALGMDSPEIREKLAGLYGLDNLVPLNSHISHISSRARIGKGCVVQHRAILMPLSRIGNGCHLNCNTTIHHESELGDYCTMAPGSILLGRVKVGSKAYIGAGAIIKENCRIGSGAVIGAGAVVVNDIPENTTIVGVPARRQLNR